MPLRPSSHLHPRKHYLQIALNGTLEDARKIIARLPASDRILVEAGTPLIKQYGEDGIRQICDWYTQRLSGSQFLVPSSMERIPIQDALRTIFQMSRVATTVDDNETQKNDTLHPYVVADLKTMDRAETEVAMAARAGASAAVVLGNAPIETINAFVEACNRRGIDAMIDMMNVEYPLAVLRTLKRVPPVVIVHRGVDEEAFNHEKQIPLHEIRRIKGSFNIMVAIAGGDTLREVQRSIFNDADIVVIWKSVYQATSDTVSLVEGFLKEVS